MQGFLLGHHTAGATTAKQTAWGKLLWDWHLAVQEHEQLCLLSQNPVFLRDCLLAFLAPGGGSLYRRGGAAYCVLQPLEMGLMCVVATLLWSSPKGEEIFPSQVEQHGANGWSNSPWSRLSAGQWSLAPSSCQPLGAGGAVTVCTLLAFPRCWKCWFFPLLG